MNKHLALVLGLACVANGALAASSLVIASDRSTLVLDYLEVFIGGSKTTYQANLVSTDNLASFSPISASAVGANSAADPATTPRLSLVNGNYVLEIPSVSVGSQTYAVNLVSSNNLASFSVDNGSLKSVGSSKPSSVAIAAVNSQTVGTSSIASSTQRTVSWVAPSGASATSYQIDAREISGVGKISTSATAGATSATLTGLKASTDYVVNVTACFNTACSVQATSTAATTTTPGEYWQLQGSGNGYAAVSKVVADGSSLSWVMRWGSEAGSSYSGRYQYYFKSNLASTRGIGIATTSASGTSTSTLGAFTQNTAAGLRNPCNGPDSTADCPSSAAYFINAIQAVPLTSNKMRIFFEALDATETAQPTRIYQLDSQDGLVGQDFNASSSVAYCGGVGSTDYMAGGSCAPSVTVGVSTDTGSKKSALSQARQFKIGWDWLKDWRWDEAVGTFMVITGADACGKEVDALFYATWDGSKWTVATDSAGCATPIVSAAHGPVLVPLGGASYKMYYEDQSGGTQSGKPLRFVYADGSWSGTAGSVDIGDWEPSAKARDVTFLWPDGTALDAQDEAGLGDHMVITPAATLDPQYMYVNLGGFDNSKWKAMSSGLGLAKLLNP